MDIYYIILYFFVYGFIGWCAEVGYAGLKEGRFINRGFLSGPICPIYGVGVTIVITFLAPYKGNWIVLYLSSVILVTLLEGLTGWAMDKIFHNKWWDYSDRPFNICGYVCLIFSLLWGVACVLITDFIHPLIHKLLTLLPHMLGLALIVILGTVMLADLYVTASAIFKFNKRLASMEKIARELHEISEQIGEDIFEKVVIAKEKQEISKQRLDVAAAEIKEKTQEAASGIKERTQEAASGIREKTQEAASGIRERTQEATSGIRERTQEAASGIREKTQEAATGIREKTQEAASGIRERTQEATSGIRERTQEATSGIRERTQEAASGIRERTQEAASGIKAKTQEAAAELKVRYQELSSKPPRISRRLVKAFPKLESRNYKSQLEELRKKIVDKKGK